MSRTLIAALAVIAVSPLSAQAKAVYGMDGLIAVDSSSQGPGPSLPASSLTLLTGATADNQVIAGSPVDGESYSVYILGTARFELFSNWNNGGDNARASTNGFLSFNRNQRGECRDGGDNTDLSLPPMCRAKMLMPFFDDLAPVSGTSTITHGYTAGTGNDFWYFQWNDFALASNPAARLTFRVTYFEATRSVRFNYIKLEGAGADGSGATIAATQCYARNRGGEPLRHRVVYSYNQAVLPTGTAAGGSSLFAIEISRDNDGDGLPASIEATLGTSDSSFDSDGCGEGDGAEYAAGRDPLSPDCGASPDDLATDTDGDGITDADELWFGLNPSDDDTDGDFATDGDELFSMGTNPLLADTDGDGWEDGLEDLDFDGNVDGHEDTNRNGVLDPGEDNDGDEDLDPQESNPLDITDMPGRQLLVASGATGISPYHQPNHMDGVLDAAGNLHFVTEERAANTGIIYGMIKANGSTGIAPTLVTTGTMRVRKPHLHVRGGTVTIVYTAHPGDPYDYDLSNSGIGFVQLDIGAHPLNGSGLAPRVPVASNVVEVPGTVTHWSVVFDDEGTAHCFYDDHAVNHSDGSGTPSKVRYARISPAGQLVYSSTLTDFRQGSHNNSNDGDNWYGQHRVQDPRAALGPDGRLHVMWLATIAPGEQVWDYERFPTGLYYAVLEPNGTMRGAPVYVGDGRMERFDVALHPNGKYLYVAATGKDDDEDGYYQRAGVRAAVIDLDAFSVVPRVGDRFGVEWAVADTAFIMPMTVLHADGDGYMGAKLLVASDGNAVFAFYDSESDDMSFLSFGPQGQVHGVLLDVTFGNSGGYSRNRRLAMVPWGNDYAIVTGSWSDGDLRFGVVKGSLLPTPDFGGINAAPQITSAAPGGTYGPGQGFRYAATATDDRTAAGALTWGLAAGPASANVDATGVVSWTPASADLGDWLFALRVCDDDSSLPRCGEQRFVVTVAQQGDLLRIVSIPATAAYVGRPYQYLLLVDGGGLAPGSVTYSIAQGQSGNMAIGGDGVLSWTPSDAEIGVSSLLIQAMDANGRTASQAFQVAVLGADAVGGGPAAAPPTVVLEDGGCGCRGTSAGDGLVAGLLALGWLFLRSRRRAA